MISNPSKTLFLSIFLLGTFLNFLCINPLWSISQAGFFNTVNRSSTSWMQKQIDKDLKPYRDRVIPLTQMIESFSRIENQHLLLVKFTISDGKVYVEENQPSWLIGLRTQPIKTALEKLCSLIAVPDTIFFASMHDGLHLNAEVPHNFPLFMMSKDKRDDRFLLFPDYEALAERHQVLQNRNIETDKVSWDEKKPSLIWRGSTAQSNNGIAVMTEDNLSLFSRVRICELSQQFPNKIDAKFTVYYKEAAYLPYLQEFKADLMSYDDQVNYKYHIFLDGYTAPFSNSGWKFFSNSLVFKPTSNWIQWYYNALIPNVHYVPVKEDLGDLITKLDHYIADDNAAQKIARNAHKFATTHLTLTHDLTYLYLLILKYNELQFE